MIKWYKNAESAASKSDFTQSVLSQSKQFVEWLDQDSDESEDSDSDKNSLNHSKSSHNDSEN